MHDNETNGGATPRPGEQHISTDKQAPAGPERADPFRIDRGTLLRWGLGVVVFAIAYGVALVVLRGLQLQDTAADLAEQAGPWGAAAFVALMMAAVMSPLPDSPIALAGLVAYGPVAGLLLVVGGSWCGAAANFWLVRLLGRERFRRRFPQMAAPMDDLAGRLGFELLVLLRFVPTVSFDVVSYAAAVTRMSFPAFAAATVLGQLPGPVVVSLVGAGAGGAGRGVTVALSGLLMALILALLALRRRLRTSSR